MKIYSLRSSTEYELSIENDWVDNHIFKKRISWEPLKGIVFIWKRIDLEVWAVNQSAQLGLALRPYDVRWGWKSSCY